LLCTGCGPINKPIRDMGFWGSGSGRGGGKPNSGKQQIGGGNKKTTENECMILVWSQPHPPHPKKHPQTPPRKPNVLIPFKKEWAKQGGGVALPTRFRIAGGKKKLQFQPQNGGDEKFSPKQRKENKRTEVHEKRTLFGRGPRGKEKQSTIKRSVQG